MSLHEWALLVQIVVVVVLLITAIFSMKSAKAARKMVYSQTLWQILDAYSLHEMSKAMSVLENWKNQHDNRFGQVFLELKEKGDSRVTEVNEARRIYYHHFHKIRQLCEADILTRSQIKLVTNEGQIRFLKDYVKPMHDSEDMSTFKFFEELYGIKD